jgi:gamma-glutamylcyclotransferase (GGCT)/AIG2-like uncharacterized protein YtfP
MTFVTPGSTDSERDAAMPPAWLRVTDVPGFAEMVAIGDSVTGGPESRLATYGTLAPGRQNHGVVSDLPGRWLVGRVRGSLVEDGWGAALGYPALVPDPDGEQVEVFLLESRALPQNWHRLDEFEGAGYRRIPIDVWTDEGVLPASIYVLAVPAGE